MPRRFREMLRRWWWTAAVLVVIVVAALTYEAPKKGDKISLFFTATVNGNVEPCGCPVNPSGGVARRAWYIRESAPEDDAVILLDGGDVVGPPSKTGLLQTEYLFRAMQKMGYTVLGLGARDFVFGLDFLRAAEQDYGFTFTSANLVTTDGDLVFHPYALMKAGRGRIFGIPFGGITVGIISVMGFDLQPLCPTCKPSLGLLNPFDSVKRTASAIRPNVDIVVLLAYTTQKEIERFLTIPDLDVVIAARTLYVPEGFDNAGMHGHAALGYTGYEGRRIGYMHIERGEDGKIVSATGDLFNLGQTVPDDPEFAGLVKEYRAKRAALSGDDGQNTPRSGSP